VDGPGPETRAAAPADVSVALANSSPDRASSTSQWLSTVRVDLASSATAGPLVASSADLPDGLLVAGTAAGCASGGDNSFSGCAAGRGTVLLDVHGTGFFDGIHSSTFGIQRVTNVQGTGDVAEYQVTYTFCLPTPLGPCSSQSSGTTSLTVDTVGDGTVGATVEWPVSGTVTYPVGGGSVQVDYSLDSVELNLLGRSDQLATGHSADRPYDVLRLPATCGEVSVGGSATSEAGSIVVVPRSLTVTGCPTSTTPTAVGTAPYRASFATTGASPVGRTIDHFVWDFGDGSDPVSTALGAVAHTFPSSAARVVSVVAVDGAGARGTAASVQLPGAKLTLLGRSPVVRRARTLLHGLLSSAGTGLAGRELTLTRCAPTGKQCARVGRTTTLSGRHRGEYAFTVRPRSSSLYRVDFAGGTSLLGTRAARLVRVRAAG
jgi:hypothetical protein